MYTQYNQPITDLSLVFSYKRREEGGRLSVTISNTNGCTCYGRLAGTATPDVCRVCWENVGRDVELRRFDVIPEQGADQPCKQTICFERRENGVGGGTLAFLL